MFVIAERYKVKDMPKQMLVPIILLSLILQNRCESFDVFYNYVNDYLKKTDGYNLPKCNKYLYETCDSTVNDYGTHDFIIIGGGSAGSILASRLSENYRWKILLLEAGGDQDAFSDIPFYNNNLFHSDMNWGYYSAPQTTCCQGMDNHQCLLPRGKALGGSSVINGMMYVRGSPTDYNSWKEEFNISGWSYREILPYFKKSEVADFLGFDEGYHGLDGLIHVNHTAPPTDIAAYLMKALQEKGIDEVDYNGKNQSGVSRLQYNINFNKRSNGAHAYLDPIRNGSSNLNITLRAFVTKILLKDDIAYGVEFVNEGVRYRATAKLEVILSAGAFNSPQLLMLSGIGPKSELERLGIRVKNDLPLVGKNLEDHPMFVNLYIRTNLTSPNRTLKENLCRYLRGEAPLTNAAGTEMICLFNTETLEKGDANMEFLSLPPPNGVPNNVKGLYNFNENYQNAFQKYNTLTDLGFLVPLLQPKSRGTVTLNTNSAIDFPIIDLNYFSDAEGEDIEIMYQGIKFIESISETKAFRSLNATLISSQPGCEHLKNRLPDRHYWYCAIRHAASTIFHPVGTSKMGTSPMNSVVNEDCLVHNMRNLRVVDAGVIPKLIRGHTNAPTTMIAEKISDVLKEFHGYMPMKCTDCILPMKN